MSDADQQNLREIARNAMDNLNRKGMTWTDIYLNCLAHGVKLQYQPQNLFDWQFERGQVTHADVLTKFARVDEIQQKTGWPFHET